MSRPFRFGLQAYTAESPQEWRDLARKAEDLGFSSFHLADHYIGEGPALAAANHPHQNLAAIPAMAVAAEATSTIRVGCRVLCCDYHQPVVLAKEVATIDWFSGGRLELGLGAGWVASEYAAMGIPMDRPGVRIDRMVETLQLIRQHYSGEPIAMDGDHVRAVDFTGSPEGTMPPVMIGGGSPRVLGIAGREADIVSINFDNSAGKIGPDGVGSATASGTADKIGWIRAGAGDRFDDIDIEIAAYFTVVTSHAAAVQEQFGQLFGLPTEEIATHPHCAIGTADEIIELLQARREQYGINYVSFGGSVIDDVAPVVAALAGT